MGTLGVRYKQGKDGAPFRPDFAHGTIQFCVCLESAFSQPLIPIGRKVFWNWSYVARCCALIVIDLEQPFCTICKIELFLSSVNIKLELECCFHLYFWCILTLEILQN